jgi:hypothetical protein
LTRNRYRRRKMRKIIALLLIIGLCTTLVPAGAAKGSGGGDDGKKIGAPLGPYWYDPADMADWKEDPDGDYTWPVTEKPYPCGSTQGGRPQAGGR